MIENENLLDAQRYRWLRTHLEFINFAGGHVFDEIKGSVHSGFLTCDTCDVGLDYAIDKRIAAEKGNA